MGCRGRWSPGEKECKCNETIPLDWVLLGWGGQGSCVHLRRA